MYVIIQEIKLEGTVSTGRQKPREQVKAHKEMSSVIRPDSGQI